MVAKRFEVGDLVWAKMKGYPPWPGKIMDPPADAKVRKAHHYVFFYGSENFAWIPDEGIFLHEEKLIEKYANKDQKRPANFRSAVDTIINASKGSSKYMRDSESSYEKPSIKEEASAKSKNVHSNSVTKKADFKKKVPLKKITVKKESRKRASSSGHNGAESRSCESTPKKQRKDEDFSDLFHSIKQSHQPNMSDTEERVTSPPPIMGAQSTYVDRPQTPSLDLDEENDVLKLKNIVATTKRIGFLGLGKMGQGIVKNLLQSGHNVAVWNRRTSECEKFVKFGAEQEQTPADVVLSCDITFCCVSDPEASKELVFGNCGVLKGLEAFKPQNTERKGYVELTSLDPKTSRAIHDEVTLKGGRYLEAPLTGSREEAIKGTLFILGAGDRDLFNDCDSCFRAMGKNALFISVEVGNASKYNIVHSMLVGTVYAAVAESLALIDRLGLAQSDYLDILHYGVLNSPVVINKGHSMIKHDYTSNTPLKHIQKDLNLALNLGHSVQQCMPIAAAANEVYKHCKLLRYADHDVGAVYEGTKR